MLEYLGLAGLGAAAGAAAIHLGWQSRTAGAARKRARAGYLDRCLPLLEAPVKGEAPTGFARASGRYRGWAFDIQVIPDTLTFRKLPTLWLLVTIPQPLPVRATLDILRRPTGTETYSNFGTLPVQIDPLPGLPPDAAIRTDDPDGLPPDSLLQGHLGLMALDRAKELVVSPRGLRIVWLAEEADRGRYLLFRDAEMGAAALDPGTLSPLLDHLTALAAALSDHSSDKEAAQ